ncbi:putative nad dependent epimerase dehydratase family protein [Emericellopsis cladophorae]|uniref:Nad dependent epimerase dehydratase family protein n=1 Tax=Emericellopsis cladophorae TaxID=2686198 RepID=A0A9Q0BBW7_9HYPO|nr:putative nad dependent epimerase dehydratase family protein [Emericellopsis cladophorae]KAI6779106.1 putative nad dependent epimerase dehydratase family protein [Emericellopsis cladophorae]
MFSCWTDAHVYRPLFDTDDNLYEIQKEQGSQQAHQTFNKLLQRGVSTNILIIDQAATHGVHGKGQGFGNPISIQTVALIKAAKALQKVCRFDAEGTDWPISHFDDTTSQYRASFGVSWPGKTADTEEKGYYLDASRNVALDDMCASVAKALYKRGIFDSPEVSMADGKDMETIAQTLGSPTWHVSSDFGGK